VAFSVNSLIPAPTPISLFLLTFLSFLTTSYLQYVGLFLFSTQKASFCDLEAGIILASIAWKLSHLNPGRGKMRLSTKPGNSCAVCTAAYFILAALIIPGLLACGGGSKLHRWVRTVSHPGRYGPYCHQLHPNGDQGRLQRALRSIRCSAAHRTEGSGHRGSRQRHHRHR
jgi:hypothetical protein